MCVIDGIKKCIAMNRWSYPLKSLELFFDDFMSDVATRTKCKYLLQFVGLSMMCYTEGVET